METQQFVLFSTVVVIKRFAMFLPPLPSFQLETFSLDESIFVAIYFRRQQ
jgi:hypothetical protein